MKKKIWILALLCIPFLMYSGEDKDGNGWKYHGNVDVGCCFDNNVNSALSAAAVADGYTDLSATFFMQRFFDKDLFAELSTNVLHDYYFDNSRLTWQDIDITGKTVYRFADDWHIDLRARGGYHYQPNVIDASNELTGAGFTGNFSHFETAFNPSIKYQISDCSSLEISDMYSKEEYKKIAGQTDYDNIGNKIFLTGKCDLEKWEFELLGSYSHKKYSHMRPFGNDGALEGAGSYKKLRHWGAEGRVGYDFDICETHLIYSYGNQKDNHENYDGYNSNKVSVIVPYKWKEDASIMTSFVVSYEYQKYLGRFLGNDADNSKVHLSTYEIAVHPAWHIDENIMIQAKASYEKRNTNVTTGTLDREFSRLLCEVGINYIF